MLPGFNPYTRTEVSVGVRTESRPSEASSGSSRLQNSGAISRGRPRQRPAHRSYQDNRPVAKSNSLPFLGWLSRNTGAATRFGKARMPGARLPQMKYRLVPASSTYLLSHLWATAPRVRSRSKKIRTNAR